MTNVAGLLRKRGAVIAVLAVVGFAGTGMLNGAAAQAKSNSTKVVSSTDRDFTLGACHQAPCTSHHTVTVTCPSGHPTLLSGGVTDVNDSNGPFGDGGDVEVHQSYPVINQFGQTWAVDLTSINGATNVNATAWAICQR